MGFDLDQGDIVLRSGTLARQAMPLRTFEHTLAPSPVLEHGGDACPAPCRLPSRLMPPNALHWVCANSACQSQLPVWSTLVQRWPDRLLGYLAWGKRCATSANTKKPRNDSRQLRNDSTVQLPGTTWRRPICLWAAPPPHEAALHALSAASITGTPMATSHRGHPSHHRSSPAPMRAPSPGC